MTPAVSSGRRATVGSWTGIAALALAASIVGGCGNAQMGNEPTLAAPKTQRAAPKEKSTKPRAQGVPDEQGPGKERAVREGTDPTGPEPGGTSENQSEAESMAQAGTDPR